MSISIPILLGLEKSATVIDATKIIGEFVKWYEILSLSGIIFAISEFMESAKLRRCIFKFGDLSRNIYALIIFSIVTVIIGDLILPLINTQPYSVPLLDYPAFWEILSLGGFTVVLILILLFSLFPLKFIPKINYKNCHIFYKNIHGIVLNEPSKESLSAISTILYENLDTIFKYASKYDRHWNIQGSDFKSPYDLCRVPKKYQKLVDYSYDLIQTVLSNKDYCNYLSLSNIGFVLKLIEKTNQYNLYSSCGYVFFNSLGKELFENEDSHLSRELEFRGVGLHKPIFNALFTSLGIVEAHHIFDSISLFNEKYWNVDTISKYIEGLSIAIKEYVKEPRSKSMSGSGSSAIYFALEKLPHALTSIFLRIKKIEDDEIYHNKYEDVIRSICNFYGMSNLKMILSKNDTFEPKFSKDDLAFEDYSMAKGIAKSIFEFLDALTILQHEQYARHLSTEVFWAIFPVESERQEIILNLEDELLKMISERVEENKKGHYPPITRVLINIYGFEFHSGVRGLVKIGQYIEKEFKDYFAPRILEDEAFEKKYLPNDCKVDREKGIIKDSNGVIMYETSKSAKSKVKSVKKD